jgi:adenosylhomocysteine nucleosidase
MLLAAVGMKREAAIVQGPGVRVAVGGGRSDLLAQRLEAALDAVDAIISIGLGGALDPALKVGDLVIGTAVYAEGDMQPTDRAWTARLAAVLPGAKLAPVYGSEIMALHPSQKAKLAADSGAVLVDMESHVVARIALAHGLPFMVLRVVSDTARTFLPPAVLHGLKPDGGVNLAGVLAALARRPGQLPALMRTGRDAEMAFKALATAWALCDLA